MDILIFVFAAFIYIMVIHFAFGIKKEFDLFQMAIYFVIGGAIGWYIGSMVSGFLLGIVLTLLFY